MSFSIVYNYFSIRLSIISKYFKNFLLELNDFNDLKLIHSIVLTPFHLSNENML